LITVLQGFRKGVLGLVHISADTYCPDAIIGYSTVTHVAAQCQQRNLAALRSRDVSISLITEFMLCDQIPSRQARQVNSDKTGFCENIRFVAGPIAQLEAFYIGRQLSDSIHYLTVTIHRFVLYQ
jgi:hypothetical protein